MVAVSKLDQILEKRKAENNFRQLPQQRELIDFVSNDYLGLSRSEELSQMIRERYERLPGVNNGATGSRLLSGNSDLAGQLEEKLAKIFKGEATLLFNSGYSANLGVLSAIPQRGDTILYDELSHACIKDGARLSMARRMSFRHNDLEDLEMKILDSHGEIYIVAESIYSMDGDVCPLEGLVELATRYDAKIILDEAHGTGVFGIQGLGYAVSAKQENKIFARIYTFGKALGVHGACVVGDRNFIDYLINFSRPFIYTTALPPHSLVSIDCAFDFLFKNMKLLQQLQQQIFFFREAFRVFLKDHPEYQNMDSNSMIQPMVVPGNEKAKALAQHIQDSGYDVRAILSPTVKSGTERLRVCLHAYNSDEEIKGLITTIESFQS